MSNDPLILMCILYAQNNRKKRDATITTINMIIMIRQLNMYAFIRMHLGNENEFQETSRNPNTLSLRFSRYDRSDKNPKWSNHVKSMLRSFRQEVAMFKSNKTKSN